MLNADSLPPTSPAHAAAEQKLQGGEGRAGDFHLAGAFLQVVAQDHGDLTEDDRDPPQLQQNIDHALEPSLIHEVVAVSGEGLLQDGAAIGAKAARVIPHPGYGKDDTKQ